MTQKVELPSFMMHDNPDSLHQLDILLNYTCNFKCVYCYSAQGRSQKEIDWISIKAMLDYLFDSNKKQTRPYVIHFSGGGEPLMSFQLIKQTVEYIEEKLLGNLCGMRGTSCADQLAKGVRKAYEETQK